MPSLKEQEKNMQQTGLTVIYNSTDDARKAEKLLNKWLVSYDGKLPGSWIGNLLINSGTFKPEDVTKLNMTGYYVSGIFSDHNYLNISLLSDVKDPLIMWQSLLLNEKLPHYSHIDYYMGDWDRNMFITNMQKQLPAYAFKLKEKSHETGKMFFLEKDMRSLLFNFAQKFQFVPGYQADICVRQYRQCTFSKAIDYLESEREASKDA